MIAGFFCVFSSKSEKRERKQKKEEKEKERKASYVTSKHTSTPNTQTTPPNYSSFEGFFFFLEAERVRPWVAALRSSGVASVESTRTPVAR